MKILLTCMLAFLSCLAFSQFAIVHDKDGYCNVRSAADVKSEATDKLKNGHFVFCFEKKGNWINVDYEKNKVESNAYVYYDRVKFISDYKRMPFITKGYKSVTLGADSIRIIVEKQEFDKTSHKLSYNGNIKSQIKLINGKQYWGTDGEMPKSEYKSIIINFGRRKIILPKVALDNLFEPNLTNTEVNYDQINDVLYIQSMNSDGAGGYQVIWKIDKGIYKNRFIAYGF